MNEQPQTKRTTPEQFRRVREVYPEASPPPILLWVDENRWLGLWLAGRLNGQPDFTGRGLNGSRRILLRLDGKALAGNYQHYLKQGYQPYSILRS